jgi:hypothetical protein
MQKIHVSIVEGKNAVCFDTGLDPRSFARTKMSQSLIEPGYLVHPDGTNEVWKSAGVKDLNGNMRVWGPPVAGKRLDQIIEKENQDMALRAIAFWIRAKMLLGDAKNTLNPGATFVCCGEDAAASAGEVFFAPHNLSNRCLVIENNEDYYNCPDLSGMEAAAFCAAVMLYRILAAVHPYQLAVIFQDMREGVFLPPRLAAPGLDGRLCELIEAALLLPVEKKRTGKSGSDILSGILNMLMGKEIAATGSSAATGSGAASCVIVSASALFSPKTKELAAQNAKEKKSYLFKMNTSVKTRRFVARNRYVLTGIAVGLVFLLIIIFSTTKNYRNRQTTEGLPSEAVVAAYYDAFSALNHTYMEAIILGAEKTDVNTAVSLFAVMKTRQFYENSSKPSVFPAKLWRDMGGELPAPNVFGVTDLRIIHRDGDEEEDVIVYQADYQLWTPIDEFPFNRSDVLILKRDRQKNWRITEILRTEK